MREHLHLPLCDVVSYDKQRALSGSLADGTEIGIRWNKTKVFFILYRVSTEKGKEIQKEINKKIITGKGRRNKGHFVFSCDLQEFDNCRKSPSPYARNILY